MSASKNDGWLDALARRTVAGETAEPTAPPTRHVLSRRVFMRIAGAVALTGGALRMVTPTAALAQDSAACIKARTKENTAALQECLRGPAAAYKEAGERYDQAKAVLDSARPNRKQRAEAERQLRGALGAMTNALADSNRCQTSFAKQQNDSEFNCRVIGPPQRPQPGDEPAQPPQNSASNGTCPGETFACQGQDGRCCYNGTFCCGCGCCIYNDCRCCVTS